MKPINLRTGIRGLIMVVIAASSGILAACSAQSQSRTSEPTTASFPSPVASGAGSMAGMDHGGMAGMDHSMNMDLGPADADYDLRFIDAMTPHHEGAIVMAKEALQKAKHPEIKKLATNIISAQNKEISELKKWRTAWYPQASAEPMAYNSQMGHMMPMKQEQKQAMMMNLDLGAADDSFDLRFINAMIPHHEGAVVMAKDSLGKSKRPELQTLAKDIITSQQAEIAEMKQWRKVWYKQ
jgi:uncharacterized protein (DUF305 family)